MYGAIREFLKQNETRVILSGAHSTGKSQVARLLSGLLDLPYDAGITRRVLSAEGHSASHDDPRVQQAIHYAYNAHLRDAEGALISDRGLVDVQAYSLQKFSSEVSGLGRAVMVAGASDCASFATEFAWPKAITFLICPDGREPEQDGVREPGLYRQMHIHYLIRGMLQDFGYLFFPISGSTAGEKAEAILGALNEQINPDPPKVSQFRITPGISPYWPQFGNQL